MIIVGLNAFHADAAAVLLRDGVLVAAVEEERFRRVKHWSGFPAQALAWCLKQGGVQLADVDHIAINQNNWANLPGKLAFMLSQRPGLGLWLSRWRNRRARNSLADLIAETFHGQRFRGRVHHIEHHLAHLASAFHVSPFSEAALLSIDGFGDFSSTAWGVGTGADIRMDGRVNFPHSLGIFYQAMTQYLGFPHYGDEYKVMGLAPYGAPRHMEAMRRIVRTAADGRYALDLSYFRHHREPVSRQDGNGAPDFDDIFSPQLEELLGPRRKPHEPLTERHHNIAHSVQAMYEEAFFNLLNALQRNTGLTQLALAGGCAMNSVANGKSARMTPFRDFYVPPAAGDAGGALGAALAVWHRLGGARKFAMDRADWGPTFSRDEIAQELANISEAGFVITEANDDDALCSHTAQCIADGQVVGWFQSGCEWGPRALGHRSILGDPRRADMKAVLNMKIKRRESFRPFAPSILREEVPAWFEQDGDVPFMSSVFQVRSEKRPLISAVTHVDGSGRLQTVAPGSLYRRLIEAFHAITGVPMLLNTSFNENEPIVCTPGEALDCFRRTKMDLLVLGPFVLERAPGADWAPKSQQKPA
ncbi:MAG: carbamoyltransferase C-terminal domain-containing protein [Pseudolabrys sp.]|nr:carbamoyltransferase C-terminal domain-containing protein [Pseudolabrys sp.]